MSKYNSVNLCKKPVGTFSNLDMKNYLSFQNTALAASKKVAMFCFFIIHFAIFSFDFFNLIQRLFTCVLFNLQVPVFKMYFIAIIYNLIPPILENILYNMSVF